jgi:hypothetical protein
MKIRRLQGTEFGKQYLGISILNLGASGKTPDRAIRFNDFLPACGQAKNDFRFYPLREKAAGLFGNPHFHS